MAQLPGESRVVSIAGRARLRPKDISEMYGISLTPIYTAIYRGDLKAQRFQTRTWLIEPQDVESWIERNSVSNVKVA
ncbi:MAG: helix-turn-helix domain-containing protein [Thermomicrobiales bacterium]